ncbi:hypothetical protein DRO02_00810 [archaeon]|nr:MAG: hypothetical protein DRO02_00810 [archaeon]RLG66209.1 MAG: hypothetical protein DRO21_00165 [archaeon]HDM24125.1 hypothetical protein [Candidatus Bathyarchaeota archaeon]
MGIADPSAIKSTIEELTREKDRLVDELLSLKGKYEKGEISKEEYEEKRRKIERKIVEVMDRLVQLGFILGNVKAN